MKKLLPFLFFVLLYVSCESTSNAEWSWEIRNKTDQILKIKWYNLSKNDEISEFQIREIKQNSLFEIYQAYTSARKPAHFDYYFRKSVVSYGEDVYWQILSEDNVVLKTWKYSDKNLQEQRFFEESSWSYWREGGEWFLSSYNTWTFDILPEDIEPANQ